MLLGMGFESAIYVLIYEFDVEAFGSGVLRRLNFIEHMTRTI
jgi:hypothetical protein|uniref:Uncharacterized protein n=1 Tax=Picea glauca TaxID=3330 RepID=A0A101LZW1_PICGL|nr:hypothetical protein ABT39_MTgene4466 [Picea glauca]QHR91328.1 hypothetical protein Q903MT_gene5360 [Picea sitchensis]